MLAQKIRRRFGDQLADKHFAVWGLAFKPDTDDMRDAPSRTLLADLFEAGATATAYDPVAMHEARVERVKGQARKGSGLAFCPLEAPPDQQSAGDRVALAIGSPLKAKSPR